MMNKKVLLCTGGIGSGKSYVIRVFNTLGIPAYDSDTMTKLLYDKDEELLDAISKIAGKDIVIDGVLQRKLFASRIFTNADLLEQVENVVHPAVIRDFNRWKTEQNSDFVIIESAILLEKPELASVPDYILAVVAPLSVRIERVMNRDGISQDEVLARIDNQWSDEERIRMADFVIRTNDADAILPDVLKIMEEIRNGRR
ncbi:MAG: dephospho-CoA kinase [Bacteroidales bacterium]|nr:dephospho-CoA kinase [Bacteroidales bacterium]MDD4671133.1 dephospho-CoA kinase [Bacteroidales bacterium]